MGDKNPNKTKKKKKIVEKCTVEVAKVSTKPRKLKK